jgi:putative ABC transport system permease protein
MTLLLRASRQFFLRHPAQLALALLGVAAGVAVVTGVGLLRSSMIDSLDSASRALAGDDSLRIESALGSDLDERWFGQLSRRTGSPVLIPFLAERVRAGDVTLELLGTDPISASSSRALAPYRGPASNLLGTPDSVLLNRATADRLGLEIGDPLSVRLDGETVGLQVLDILDGELWLDNRLLLDLSSAQRLLDRTGRLSWISAPRQAQDWLTRNLDDSLRLVEAEQRRASVEELTEGMRINLTALSLLALVVGLFVVHSVLSFLLVQRQRQIGMLRALGVTPGRLRLWLLLEVAGLTLLGGLIGLALGTELARGLLTLIQSPAAELYGLVTGQQILPSRGLYLSILGFTLTLAGVSVSGLIAAALKIPPGQLSRGQATSMSAARRGLAAALLALTGAALMLLSSHLVAALLALFVWLSACALIAPDIGLALLGAIRRSRPTTLGGRALAMLAGSRQRLAPSLAALSLALGLSAGMALMVGGFRAAVDDWVSRLLQADAYLSVDGGTISDSSFQEIQRDWPEIAAVSSVRRTRLPDGTPFMAYDLPAPAREGFEFLSGGGPEAWAAFERGQGVLVSEPLAQRRALSLGERIQWTSPAGQESAAIVGIYRDYADDRGQIALAGNVYRRQFADPDRDSVGLYLKPGAGLPDIETLAARLALAPERLDLTRREEVRRITLEIFDRTFRITQALAILVGLIATISLVSALMALGLERRRDYATLRALGLSESGLVRWILTQTVGLSLVAAILAVPISLLIHSVLSLAVQPRAFGWSVPLEVGVLPWIQLFPLALIAGLLAGIVPAWTIRRSAVARHLKDR